MQHLTLQDRPGSWQSFPIGIQPGGGLTPRPPAVVQGQKGWDRAVGPTAGTSIPDSGLGGGGVKPVPKRNPQVPLGRGLLPLSLLPSPQPPLPGQYSQEAQEKEEEEQGLDSHFPDGYQDRLCRAR